MSYALIDTTDLTALGDAIRAKTSTTAPMSVSAMADAVDGISAGEEIDEIIYDTSLWYWNYRNINYDFFKKYRDKIVFITSLKAPTGKFYLGAGAHYAGINNFWASTYPYYGSLSTSSGIIASGPRDYPGVCVDLRDKTIWVDMENMTQLPSTQFNMTECVSYSAVYHLPKFRIKNNENNISSFIKITWQDAFKYAYALIGIEDDTFPTEMLGVSTIGYPGLRSQFVSNYLLRYMPDNFLSAPYYEASNNHSGNMTTAAMSNRFDSCYWLKKIIGCAYDSHINGNKITTNTFSNAFRQTCSLHHLTFYQPNNQVGVMNASNQVIDLTTAGFWNEKNVWHFRENGLNNYSPAIKQWFNTMYGEHAPIYIDITMINDSDIIDKMLNENSIAGGKQNGSNMTADPTMATYNRQSAIETINSLPDTSAAGGGNTIKFKATAGSAYGTLYDMSELTAAEIAVATAKGWTVSLV